MAQRHCRVHKTSKCSSDTYASSSLSSDFMWNINIASWKNWESSLVSDPVAEIMWFDPEYLLGPQSPKCVISETHFWSQISVSLNNYSCKKRLERWEGTPLTWIISCCLCRSPQFFCIYSSCAWFWFTSLVVNINLK